ncbi:hypothetical protein ACS386_09065 [Flavobacteriaceae bacterium LMO-SS05]
MKFEDSKYFYEYDHKKIVFPFGNFYLCNHFLISELNEGVHFSWEKIELVAQELLTYYGSNVKLKYISNRVNSYSMEPQSWSIIENKYGFFEASAIVYYSDIGYNNVSIEKLFTNKNLKRCVNLDEAFEWIKNQREFSQNSNVLPSSANSTD